MAFDIPLSSFTHSRSVLRSCLVASAAPAPTTTTFADFSLRQCRLPFRNKARSPQVRVAHLHRTTAAFTPPRLGHKSFAVMGLLALLGNAFYAVLVHRLTIYAPRFLPTLGRPHAVALHFAHCDQLAAGLAPAGVRPCWAHPKKGPAGPWGFSARAEVPKHVTRSRLRRGAPAHRHRLSVQCFRAFSMPIARQAHPTPTAWP